MDFTSTLRRRLLGVAAVTVPAAALAGACASNIVDGTAGIGGQGTSVGAGGQVGAVGGHGGAPSGAGGIGLIQTFPLCFSWPYVTVCGSTVASSSVSTSTGGEEGTGGAGVPPCPPSSLAASYAGCSQVGTISDGVYEDGQCCYQVVGQFSCGSCTGRPFTVAGEARTAATRRGLAGAWSAGEATPCVDDLSPALRGALAEAWAQDGLMEHASVASFGRFALELLAAGAPAHLVEEAHRAALDEVRHARLCLALASAYAGEPVEPAPFPFEGHVAIDGSLASIAARTLREGCAGETIAAMVAAEQLAGARDPAVQAALSCIVDDESRHAELAFRTVAWALREGGAPVRAAVEGAVAELAGQTAELEAEAAPPAAALAAHGRVSPEAQRRVAARALAEVVRPCLLALLGLPLGPRDRGCEERVSAAAFAA
jgi:hypothetical protein